jgi:DNA-binding NarL/FixJ family response regulator
MAFRKPDKPEPQETLLANLKIRERPVLTLLAQDVPNQEIAQKLSVSASTVKAAVNKALSKLNVDFR